jgi:hypothetical protein
MKLAIMQPYFFPYLGYFQLMNAVDEFVVYDNIEYSKGSWINRNRILLNQKDSFITLPIKNASDYLDIKDRYLADNWSYERKKIINKISSAYQKAPYFEISMPLIEKCLAFENVNLFSFVYNSIIEISHHLCISTSFVISSQIQINHQLKAINKVIEICTYRNATNYINPIGGLELYKKQDFLEHGILLNFIKSNNIVYKQYNNPYIPWLSIIDVMMFNSINEIQKMLDDFELI